MIPLSALASLSNVVPDLVVVFEWADSDLEKRRSEACNTVLWNFRGYWEAVRCLNLKEIYRALDTGRGP